MTNLEPQHSVLIIEDEASFREALVMAIGDEGYHVHCASNGAEAIALLEKVNPDIIILDLHMPVMGGPAFLSEYRARTELTAPVIICSTRRHDASISRLNVSAFLVKPVDIDELLEAIRFNIPKHCGPQESEKIKKKFLSQSPAVSSSKETKP